MRVIKCAGNGWEVWNGPKFIGHFSTNSQAWRAVDVAQNEAKSRAEDVSDWIHRKNLNE